MIHFRIIITVLIWSKWQDSNSAPQTTAMRSYCQRNARRFFQCFGLWVLSPQSTKRRHRKGISVLLVEVTGLEPAISSSRTMRDTTFATPRCGKNIRFFCKWSNMWSDRRFNDFSTFGRAEKVSVFKGFRLFSKNLRRARWLRPERSALPSWATPRYEIV